MSEMSAQIRPPSGWRRMGRKRPCCFGQQGRSLRGCERSMKAERRPGRFEYESKGIFHPGNHTGERGQAVSALGVQLPGKVAVKVHSGEKGNQNFLHPEFWRPVVEEVHGTIVECNTAYGDATAGVRDHTESTAGLSRSTAGPSILTWT